MDNRSYLGYEDEIEIDLIDLFWELLMRWKPIALCMLLCGCLLMPLMYVRSMHSYNASLAAREELNSKIEKESGYEVSDPEEEDEEQEPLLEDAQKDAVEGLVLSYRQLLDNQKIYDSTVRFRLDPDHMHSEVLYFHIHTDDPGQLTMVRDMYVSLFSTTEIKEKIADAYDMDDLYEAGQMLSVGGGDIAYTLPDSTDIKIYAQAILTPDTDAKKVASCIKSVIEDYTPEVKKTVGDHSITFMFNDEREYRDTALVTERAASESAIMSLRNTINTTLATFTDEQKQFYEYLTAKVDEEYGSNSELASDEAADSSEENTDTAAASSDEELTPPSMSPKYFLLGMLLGAFAFCGVYFVLKVIRPGINQVSDLLGTMGVHGLGELRAYPGKGAWDIFMCDPFVYGIRYKKKLDTDKEINDIRDRISLMPEYDGETVYAVPTALTAWQQDKLNTILSDTKDSAVVLDPQEFDSIKLEEKLAKHPRVILVSSAQKTPYRTASKLFGACRMYEAKLVGHILLEAVK